MKAKTLAEKPARTKRTARCRTAKKEMGASAAARPLIAAFAATASLGLLLVSPCCPAPSPALGSEAGTGGEETWLGVTVTVPAAAQGESAGEDDSTGKAQGSLPGEDGEEGSSSETPPSEDLLKSETDGSDLDVPGSPNEPAQQTTGARTGDPVQDEGNESAADTDERQGPGAQDGDLEVRPSGDKTAGCTETKSSNPMDVLLAAVERQRANGADVEVVSADPTTGRVVYE